MFWDNLLVQKQW